MINLRKYGKPPYTVAVVHGGPGARGQVAPVARKLSSFAGILEPLQTATTLDELVSELNCVLQESASLPVVLVGHSWGAWLGFIAAARCPASFKKLVLVGSGPFEHHYAANITGTRLTRLNDTDRLRALYLMEALSDPQNDLNDKLWSEFGALFAKADAFDPLPEDNKLLEMRYDGVQQIWQEAEVLRRSGELLEMGKRITCPVVAIHGDFDPHPAEGVHRPLSRVLRDFRFFLLRECGHSPWLERRARVSSIIQKRNYLNIRRNKPLNIIHAEGVNFPIIFV